MLSMETLPLPLRRGIKRGFLTVLRERDSAVSFGSFFGILLLGQLLLFLAFGAEAGIALLRQQTDLRLRILEGASDAQIQDFFQRVRSLPYVQDAVYITREQAYERQLKRDPQLVNFLTKFGIDNPFPETIGVRLRTLSAYPDLLDVLRSSQFTPVIDPSFLSDATGQEQQVYHVLQAIGSARLLALFALAILVSSMLLIIAELVARRALARRAELSIQELVGAGWLAVLLPFCTEVAVLLIAAFVLAALISWLVILLLPVVVPALGSAGIFGAWFRTAVSFLTSSQWWLLPIQVLFLLTASVGGASFALRSRKTNSSFLHRFA
jgi:cell division protein FtsX